MIPKVSFSIDRFKPDPEKISFPSQNISLQYWVNCQSVVEVSLLSRSAWDFCFSQFGHAASVLILQLRQDFRQRSDSPMFKVFAILYPDDINHIDVNRSSCCRDAQQCAGVRTADGFAGRN